MAKMLYQAQVLLKRWVCKTAGCKRNGRAAMAASRPVCPECHRPMQ